MIATINHLNHLFFWGATGSIKLKLMFIIYMINDLRWSLISTDWGFSTILFGDLY